MAESNQGQFYNKLARMDDKDTELNIEEIREAPINLRQNSETVSANQIHACDICMTETVFTLSLYLCYVCAVYMCENCTKQHNKTHECVKRSNKESKRKDKAASLVGGMRDEYNVESGASFNGEKVEVIGRVNVKHEFDEYDCRISGLSGFESKRWVIVDVRNSCMKLFCSVSNTLLRYIKFGTRPRDVTEVKVLLEYTDSTSSSVSKTFTSVAARDEIVKQYLVAVTFPDIKQIWLIDVNKTPAIKIKTVKMEKECRAVYFIEDKLFILCEEYVDPGYCYSVYTLSIELKQLKVIQIPGLSYGYINDFVVHKGLVYLSGIDFHKVLCINVEDCNVISEITLEGSGPRGISVDPNNGTLYLYGRRHNKVYKLSPDLSDYKALNLDTVYTMRPYKLCFNRNKLYFSHNDSWTSSSNNVVTVVHLLT